MRSVTRPALRVICLAFAIAAGAGAPSAQGRQETRKADLLAGLERRVLPNGLAVVVKEDRRIPTVTVMLAYRVGSVNEEPGMTGVSHFFEHMVFKGTEKYKRGDIDLVTYRCGGENNAFTTNDMTGYWFHVGSEHLDAVLDILADTMGNCTLDAKEFDLERNTVLQEMNLWLDGPWGQLEHDLEKTIYEKSAYRHPVLGWKGDVEKLTRDQMMAYYKDYYTPNNASLVVLGDVRKGDVFRAAERHFGKLPRGKDAAAARAAEPPQAKEKAFELRTDKTSDRLILAYRAEPAGTETDITLDVIATILGEGKTSRLMTRLVEKEDLAGEGNVEVFNYSRKHEGLFSVKVELALDAPLDKTREVVVEELEALKLRPVSERELRRAKNILRADFAFEVESQHRLAEKIGYFEALGLPNYVREYMDRVEAVTPGTVRACAKKVFRDENRTVAIGKAKAKRAPSGRSARSSKRRAGLPACAAGAGALSAKSGFLQAGGAPKLGETWEVRLESGLTVLVKPKPDVPVLYVQAFVETGSLHDPEDRAGLAALTGDLLDEGIEDPATGRKRPVDDLAAEIEFVGGVLRTGDNGGSVKVLSEHAALALDLLRDVIRYPSFPEDRVAKLREDTLAQIEAQNDDPQAVAQRRFYEEAFKGHPARRPAAGYQRTVEAITREDVVRHYRRFFRPENTIVSVAGDVEPTRAVAEVRARFGDWKGQGPWARPPLRPALRQVEPRSAHVPYASRQARIHLGHVGIDRQNPDYFALRVAETILCASPGFTNRLARTVRDEQGLAYDIAGSITFGADRVASPFQVVLGVEAKDQERSLKVVLEELGKFVEDGPTEREVADARRYQLSTFVSGWETTEDLAWHMIGVRRFNLGADYPEAFHRAVSAVTPEEVRRVARKYIDLKSLTVVVVGPKN